MKFSSNYIARKNGFRYEIKYGAYLDGKEQENKFYLLVVHPARNNVSTERTLRFPSPEAAMQFCEEMIATGKVTIADLRANEEKAAQEIIARRNAEAEQKVDRFFAKMKELGVDPVAVPEILAAYREMNNTLDSRAVTIFNERIADMKKQPAFEIPDDKALGMTLGEYLNFSKADIDILLVDRETGEHDLPAICYYTPEEQASGKYVYSDLENWLISLPLERLERVNNYPMAIVKTNFSWDQVCFLLEEESGFDEQIWADYNLRANCACVGTSERLAFLTDHKPFDIPFDATRMDAANPAFRSQICEMLETSNHVYIYSVATEDKEDLYVYCLREHPLDKVLYHDFANDVVAIKLTEPGKGLTSTLDGKVAWAKHTANKAREAAPERPTPAKQTGRE